MFVVESGNGDIDSNAYVAPTEIDAYLQARGRLETTGWIDLGNTEKQQRIVRATDYIDAEFESKFHGQRLSLNQALAYPRTLDQRLPYNLILACIEYSLIDDLYPPVDNDQQAIKSKTSTVGPITESITYQYDPSYRRPSLHQFNQARSYIDKLIVSSFNTLKRS